MSLHDFIFSNKRHIRLSRHLVFWIGCWIFSSFTYYIIQQTWLLGGYNPKYVNPGSFILFKTFLLILSYAIPCYAFIIIILPLILKRKWMISIGLIFTLIILMFFSGWVMYWNIFPLVDRLFGFHGEVNYPTKFWPAIVIGLIEPLKIIAAAAIIKYSKYWWFKQKEKKTLEHDLLFAELEMLKSQINPNFLFKSLDKIHRFSIQASPKASELLVKLSDLLSYMVYECEETFVPLDKEVQHMKDYVALEQIENNHKVEIAMTVTGSLQEKKIAPFLLLPFIEYGFVQASLNQEKSWLNMEINASDDWIVMKLVISKPSIDKNLQSMEIDELGGVKKRLSVLYPQTHTLKIKQEFETLNVSLKLKTNPDFEL